MALATLSIDLVAKVASFERELKNVAAATEAQSTRIASAFGVIRSAASGLGVGLVAAGFVGAIRSASDYADEIGKTSQKIGVTTEAFSGLSYAAKLSDVSTEVLAKGLKKLSIEVDGGGEKLKKLGISTTDATGKFKDTDQLVAEIADAFVGMEDGATKTALAVALFGEKIGPELIPLLNGGSAGIKNATDEARRFGLIVSKESAKAAEEFNDNLTRLAASSKGVAVQLAGPVIKYLGETSTYFLNVARDVGTAQAALITFGKVLAETFRLDDAGVAERTGEQLRTEQERIKGLLIGLENIQQRDPDNSANNRRIKVLTAQLRTLEEQGVKATQALANALGGGKTGGGGRGSVNPDAVRPRVADRADDTTKAAQKESAFAKLQEDIAARLTAAYALQANPLQELSQAEQFATKVVQELADAKNRLTDAEKARLTTQLEQYLATAKQADLDKLVARNTLQDAERISRERQAIRNAEYQSIVEFQTQVSRADEELVASLLKRSPSAVLDEQRRVQQLLADQFKQGRFGDPDSTEAARVYGEVATTALGNVADGAARAESEVEKLGLSFTSNLEDALVKGNDLRDVFKGLGEDLLRLSVRKTITEPLAESFSSLFKKEPGSGGTGIDLATIASSFTKFFGFADGGVMTGAGAMPLRAYAKGGIARSPQVALFGEGDMAEAYVPLPDGRRIPVAMQGGGAGSTVINQTINVGAGASRNEVLLAMQQARLAAVSDVVDGNRRRRF